MRESQFNVDSGVVKVLFYTCLLSSSFRNSQTSSQNDRFFVESYSPALPLDAGIADHNRCEPQENNIQIRICSCLVFCTTCCRYCCKDFASQLPR